MTEEVEEVAQGEIDCLVQMEQLQVEVEEEGQQVHCWMMEEVAAAEELGYE